MAVQKSGDVDWSSNVLPTFLQDLILVCHVHRPSPRGRGAGSRAGPWEEARADRFCLSGEGQEVTLLLNLQLPDQRRPSVVSSSFGVVCM